MKQTAVEWLKNMYVNKGCITPTMIEQAKEMEKEHMRALYTMHMVDKRTMELYDFDEYYNETFKSE